MVMEVYFMIYTERFSYCTIRSILVVLFIPYGFIALKHF